jgi:hypothetical protein
VATVAFFAIKGDAIDWLGLLVRIVAGDTRHIGRFLVASTLL